jgi:hypothetical protein
MSLFGTKEREEIEKLNSIIVNLEGVLVKSKTKEDELIETIKEKEEQIKKISKSPHDKQFEKITLEFDRVKKENIQLTIGNTELKKEILELGEVLKKLRAELDNIKTPKAVKLPKEQDETRYKVLVKDLYSARKHDDFKKICDGLGIIYVTELENFDFEKLIEDGNSKTKVTNAKNEYLKYKNGELSFELEEYISKGHSVSKIFFRYRSFVSALAELEIEYMFQLANFDFDRLDKEKFTSSQIEKIKEKLSKYDILRKI